MGEVEFREIAFFYLLVLIMDKDKKKGKEK